LERITLLLVDDHTVLRSGLKLLIASQVDMQVVGEAGSVGEALVKATTLLPDIVVLDLSMPGQSGLEAIGDFQRIHPRGRILVLTMHDDEEYLRHVLQAGGSGYILKRAADVELLSAIRAVHRGEVYIDPSLAKALVKDVMARNVGEKGEAALSEREREVLRLVALGYTNQQVAEALVVSVKTVESHKARIKDKLGLQRRSELVRYAMQQGLLPDN